MPRKPLPRVPINAATVTVDGNTHGPLHIIWAMLRLDEGIPGTHFSSRDHALSVPRCHPDDATASMDCGWSRIRPRDKYADYRFERQKSGAWMLVLEVGHE